VLFQPLVAGLAGEGPEPLALRRSVQDFAARIAAPYGR